MKDYKDQTNASMKSDFILVIVCHHMKCINLRLQLKEGHQWQSARFYPHRKHIKSSRLLICLLPDIFMVNIDYKKNMVLKSS